MNRLFFAALLLASIFGLQGCNEPAPPSEPLASQERAQSNDAPSWYVESEDPASDVRLLKSPNDDRDYRYIRLQNGLQVVLVSDPKADKAAASLSIDIGSFENPRDRDGLAHFLEHMLFLGTDKFPEAGEYQAYLTEHGGTFNAYTSLEETNYFFDVDAAYLMSTLDRFSRFFVAPLFNPEYVDRERHAVDSEYQLKIKDDSRREWDVLREIANPAHPFSGFSVGNLDTLANPPEDPVRDDLLEFYEKYYSANRMTLVVLGRESLDELQNAIGERFAEVPRREVVTPATETPMFRDSLPLEVHIKPEKELRSISFNFPVPSVEQYWREKPLEFLGHLLGHEGEGSLIQSLKQRGLADRLSAGLSFDSRHGALFSVDIRLTPAGFDQVGQVEQDFFAWLDLVKREGVEKWRYDEVARLGEQDFRFAEQIPPMSYVQRLSTSLHQVSPESLLLSGALYEKFDPDLISRYGSKLTPENVVVVISAPEVTTDRETELYGAPYQVETRKAPIADKAGNTVADLKLPAPNPYIAERLDLVGMAEPSQDRPTELADGHWYFPDHEFGTPKGFFDSRVAIAGLTGLKDAARLELLLALVSDRLSAESYPAMLAGLGFSVSPWEKGYRLTLTGYNDKQPLLLAKMLKEIQYRDWSQQQFERVRETLVRSLRNQAKEWPLRQLFTRLSPLLKEAYLPSRKADYLADISLEGLKAFQERILGADSIRSYAGGNYSRAEAEELFGQVEAVVKNQRRPVVMAIENLRPASALPETRYYVDHSDAAVILYLQGNEDTLRERAAFTLLRQILSAPFYSSLRTEKQLGYAVGSSISHLERVPGMMFYVQSPKLGPDGLKGEVDLFLQTFKSQIDQLTDEDLARYQQAVLATIEERPRNIMELADRQLESLDLGYDQFDFRNQLAQAVRGLDVASLRAIYERSVLSEREGLWVLTSADESVGVGKPIDPAFLENQFTLSE